MIYAPNGGGSTMLHLDDLKTEGGERHFIVGCFDNSGYNGFVKLEQTTADENSNHCNGVFGGSTGSGSMDAGRIDNSGYWFRYPSNPMYKPPILALICFLTWFIQSSNILVFFPPQIF